MSWRLEDLCHEAYRTQWEDEDEEMSWREAQDNAAGQYYSIII